jgi:hypothetical protein
LFGKIFMNTTDFRKGTGTMRENEFKVTARSLNKVPRSLIVLGIVLVVLIVLHPWVQVGAGQRGVVMNFGAVQNYVLDEGLHFLIPLMQKVALVNVQIQKATTETIAASSDLQDVTSTLALNYMYFPKKLTWYIKASVWSLRNELSILQFLKWSKL